MNEVISLTLCMPPLPGVKTDAHNIRVKRTTKTALIRFIAAAKAGARSDWVQLRAVCGTEETETELEDGHVVGDYKLRSGDWIYGTPPFRSRDGGTR